jgi:hypothetical protein
MQFLSRRKFAVAAVVTMVVGFLAFGGVSLGGQSRQAAPAGASDIGAIGIDLDCPAVTCPDFGIDQQLHKAARPALNDDHVIVVASQCSNDETPLVGGLGCDNGDANISQSEDEDTALCPSSWANGQLPNSPKAAKGFVCVYVLGGKNFGTIVGTGAIHGSSIAPGTLASTLGFKIGWNPDTAGDSYVDAVWAYKR